MSRIFRNLGVLNHSKVVPNFIAPDSYSLYIQAMQSYEAARISAQNNRIEESRKKIQKAIEDFENVDGEYPAVVSVLRKMIAFEENLNSLDSGEIRATNKHT